MVKSTGMELAPSHYEMVVMDMYGQWIVTMDGLAKV